MSFIKRFFTGSKKESTNTNNNNSNSNTSDNDSTNHKSTSSIHANILKCKPIQPHYQETTETQLRIENISLFDGTEIIIEKLYSNFLDDVKTFKQNSTVFNDTERHPLSCKTGGIVFTNKEITSLLRSSGTDIVKQIGKKILTGDFNLTTISFPIKVMIPYSILQSLARSKFQFPYFFNIAKDQSPVEKMKWVIVACFSGFFCTPFFLKPLNPVLGETFEAMFSDGSKIYLEQSSHHPPITHYELYGPGKGYYYSGYSQFSSSAGFNSLTVYNKGKRSVCFKDGTRIEFGFVKEVYCNSFFGEMKLESIGEILFEDKENGLKCLVKVGAVKNHPSDSLSGEITVNEKKVSSLKGSFMSNIDFDETRYWDIRENFPITYIELDKGTPSSSKYRDDRVFLEQEKLEEAQAAKEKIENIQRNDRKLREKFKKGGH